MKNFLDLLKSGQPLDETVMTTAMTRIMNGEVNDESIIVFLNALAEKGETAAEIAAAAKVLRAKALTIKAPYGAVDCCGTGGDGANTYNISTAVALVAAAAGVPVAKHGNRASSSKSGAADVLETLGISLEMPKAALEEALKTIRFAFLMAPNHHAAMKHVSAARKKMGRRTIFNLLGPLANPAGTKLQLIGVYDRKWVLPMAGALKKLGAKKAWVVHGADGLDEITLTGETFIAILDDGVITETTLTPGDFGLPTYTPEDFKGGDSGENATALRALLDGKDGAYRDIVLANTAAVLALHGDVKSLKEGVAKAAEAIDSGAARQTLRDYIAFSREMMGS